MSDKICCIPGCSNSRKSTGSKEVLHKFPNPTKYMELFNTWVYAIGGEILRLENNHIFNYRRVCRVHFEEKYWCRNNRLSNIAVPTKHMPGLSLPKTTHSESSEAASSNEPMSETPKLDSGAPLPQTLEAVQIKDTCEPVSELQKLDPGAPLPQSTLEAVPIKDNKYHNINIRIIKPIPESLKLDSGAPLPQGTLEVVLIKDTCDTVQEQPKLDSGAALPQSILEAFQIKDTCEPVPESPKLDSGASLPESTLEANQITDTCAVRTTNGGKRRTPLTPVEESLRKKLIRTSIKLSKCRNKVKKQALKIKAMQNVLTHPQFVKTLDSLPMMAKILTLMLFREHKKGMRGRRFTPEEKNMALSIFKQSPEGYRFLSKIYILPSPQTLGKLLKADIKPGIQKNETENASVEDPLCVDPFDEMALKANVAYNEA